MARPLHDLPRRPEGARLDDANWVLRVDGLVRAPASFSVEALERLSITSHTGTFACLRSASDGDPTWEGVPLAAALAVAEPLPEATWCYAHAEGFRALLSLEVAQTALLVTRLDGVPLPSDRGGPCRLFVPEQAGRLSVKWLERIELVRRRREQPPRPPAPPG